MEAQLHEVRRWKELPIDPSEHGQIKLLSAALHERDGEIVALGSLDLSSLNILRVADYQREVLHASTKKKPTLVRDLEQGAKFPTLLLGMRGQRISFPKGSDNAILLDPVFIIDGLQRVFALKTYAERHPERAKQIRQVVEVRFDTNFEQEKELFIAVNTRRTAVSPNVILRDHKDGHPGILTLYGLSHTDKNFALYERVCWNQRMSRQEILTAMALTRVAYTLHKLAAPTRISKYADQGISLSQGSSPIKNPESLDNIAKSVGLSIYRSNIVAFFDLIDECWGLRTIEYSQLAPQIKQNFLITLARLLCDHQNFWDGGKLKVDAQLKRKFASFPLLDPEIARLASAGNAAVTLLYAALIEHMNKGMRANRLVKRAVAE